MNQMSAYFSSELNFPCLCNEESQSAYGSYCPAYSGGLVAEFEPHTMDIDQAARPSNFKQVWKCSENGRMRNPTGSMHVHANHDELTWTNEAPAPEVCAVASFKADLSRQAPSIKRKRGRKPKNTKSVVCDTTHDVMRRKRVITLSQRHAANVRERKRMQTLNEAFENLKLVLPLFTFESKLSRIETLKLAIVYICFMREILCGVPLQCIQLTSFLQPIALSASRKTLPDVYL